VYFNDSAAEAKTFTNAVLDKWRGLLDSLPEVECARLQRSMGLKMEQLKVGGREGRSGGCAVADVAERCGGQRRSWSCWPDRLPTPLRRLQAELEQLDHLHA
jgi:hypothetical protein